MRSSAKFLWAIFASNFPVAALKIKYLWRFRKPLNLNNPKTLNEKIIKKIIFDRNPNLVLFADKYSVREFVRVRLGNRIYLTELYAVVEKDDEIKSLKLPEKFVMKASHGSGMAKIVYDSKQVNHIELMATARKWLRFNYGKRTGEWAYKSIKPRIMFEELLGDGKSVPDDIKFFCFNGEPKFIQVDKDRFTEHKRNFYDLDLLMLPVKLTHENFESGWKKPANFSEMIQIAKELSRGQDFLRVDLYNVSGRIVFGELTNYPGGGTEKFDPDFWDAKFGEYWK